MIGAPTVIPAEGHARRLVSRRKDLHKHLDRYIDQLATTGQSMLGDTVKQLEQTALRLWSQHRTAACVALGSGSAALQGILECLQLPAGGEIITTPYTFIATWNAISRALTVNDAGKVEKGGLSVVCVDIDPRTYLLDPEQVEAAITEKTVAIVPVHMNGLMADMRPLINVARKRDLYIIEDACQAHSATYVDPSSATMGYAGTMGHFGYFSNNTVKNAGLIDSDGGLVMVSHEAAERNPLVIENLRAWRNAGRTTSKRYYHPKLGTRSRMGEFNAMEGVEELLLLDLWNRQRREIAAEFAEACAQSPSGLIPPYVPEGREHVYFNFVVRSPSLEVKAELERRMRQANITVPESYSLICDQDPYRLRWFSWRMESASVARQVIPLLTHVPCFPELQEEERERIKAVLASV